MKNVRLFAVAAAMGMFASTVSATTPATTKDAYVATWGNVDEIIKVDMGDKVVAPTAEIKVVKETRTTDREYAGKDTTLGFVSDTKTCYAGFSNEVGDDKNLDGYVDTPILTMYPGAAAHGWYYEDTKFFPSVETAAYYVSMAGEKMYGARFLKPGSAEVKLGYHANASHKDLANVEEVIEYMTEKGIISKVDTDGDGYNDYVIFNEKTLTVTDGIYDGKTLGTVSNWISIPTTRNGETLLDEALVRAFILGHTKGAADWKDLYENSVVGVTEEVYYTETTGTSTTYKTPFYAMFGATKTDISGKILSVVENRYGELVPEAVLTSPISTASDVAGLGISMPATSTDVKVVVKDRNNQYSLYSTVKATTQKAWTIKGERVWDAKSGVFQTEDVVYDLTNDGNPIAKYQAKATDDNNVKIYWSANINNNTEGLVQYSAEANTSDKIVINTHGTGLILDISGINTNKNTMTIYAKDGTEYTVSAVKLADGKWYPAVDTEEEVLEFIEIFAGLHTPDMTTTVTANTTTTYDWDVYKGMLVGANKLDKHTYLDGTSEYKVIENALAHYSAKQCTYKLEEGTTVTPVMTSDADSIDTTTSGVKTLTLTAKVGEEVVGTKEVKVVVAPKYERVYKNGKVVKLTAKWLNGNTYAVYNYDWAAKTYTATFYQADGVTVAATSNGTL